MALRAGVNCVTATSLQEYDFGTTDGFKKKLLEFEDQIVDFPKATGEVFSDRLKCLWSSGVRKDVLSVKSSLMWQMLRTDGKKRNFGRKGGPAEACRRRAGAVLHRGRIQKK